VKRRAPFAVPGDFQILPDLTPEEFAGLKADIAANGVQVPIEIDEHGHIIDGHHRHRAWHELRAEGVRLPMYESKLRRYGSDEERIAQAFRLNAHRRHLLPDQQKQVIATLRRRGWSLQKIADELKVGKSTVARTVAGVPDSTPAMIEGLDGRHYPSSRPRFSVSVHSKRDEERVMAALSELGEDLPARATSVARLEKRAKANRVRSGAIPDGATRLGVNWRLDCADIREWVIEDDSVDLILTDPPYTMEAMPLYRDLAEFAVRVLKPGRLLIAYSGKLALPDVYDYLTTQLDYVWQGVVVQSNKPSRIHARKIEGGYRPFLMLSKGAYDPRSWIKDTIEHVTPPKKERHPWEQALEPFVQLVRQASRSGEVICDPFAGSGTTGVAALLEGRNFLGCEIDPRTAREASERLRQLTDGKIA
jgi:ParB-like chromosome segregation protein Spo0J